MRSPSCARPKLQNNLKANHNAISYDCLALAAVRDLSYRIIWKQITTALSTGSDYYSCARPKLQNNLKANHNNQSKICCGGQAVRDLSYRIIWKQITTFAGMRSGWNSCARPKLQNNLKANHNEKGLHMPCSKAVRDLSYRIIWKQITTTSSGRSQRRCCARPKLQNNLKANHNALGEIENDYLAVRDLSYRIIWKQITTSSPRSQKHT